MSTSENIPVQLQPSQVTSLRVSRQSTASSSVRFDAQSVHTQKGMLTRKSDASLVPKVAMQCPSNELPRRVFDQVLTRSSSEAPHTKKAGGAVRYTSQASNCHLHPPPQEAWTGAGHVSKGSLTVLPPKGASFVVDRELSPVNMLPCRGSMSVALPSRGSTTLVPSGVFSSPGSLYTPPPNSVRNRELSPPLDMHVSNPPLGAVANTRVQETSFTPVDSRVVSNLPTSSNASGIGDHLPGWTNERNSIRRGIMASVIESRDPSGKSGGATSVSSTKVSPTRARLARSGSGSVSVARSSPARRDRSGGCDHPSTQSGWTEVFWTCCPRKNNDGSPFHGSTDTNSSCKGESQHSLLSGTAFSFPK